MIEIPDQWVSHLNDVIYQRNQLDERFRMLCQCQSSQNPGCNAIIDGGYYRNPLAEFLRGHIRDPFCGRGGNEIMEGGIFKGRQYCWQHYPKYAICDARHKARYLRNDSARYVYLWEYHPKRKHNWEDHGKLMKGPEWPTSNFTHPWDRDWAERLMDSGEWLPKEGQTWLCEVCRDALAERLARANLKQRRNLIKQAKALGKGKEIHTWLRKYLKERQRGAYL